jgi:hypothetical protein
MKVLAYSSLVCVGLALSSTAYPAEGITVFEIPVGTCHAANLMRDLINRIFLSGPPAAHQALSSLPEDFFRIAARNRSLAGSLDTAFIPPGSSAALQVVIDNVREIEKAVDQLRGDIEAVDPDWVSHNSTVWSNAEQASLEKSNFVHGELHVFLSRGTQMIDQHQAETISKDLRDQAERMEKMGNAIRTALETSPAAGSSQQLQREDCTNG